MDTYTDLAEHLLNMDIYQQFPDVLFDIMIPKKELDEVVIDNDSATIKCESCNCFLEKNDVYYLVRKEKKGITNRDLINCLIKNNYSPGCVHFKLHVFDEIKKGMVVPFFTS